MAAIRGEEKKGCVCLVEEEGDDDALGVERQEKVTVISVLKQTVLSSEKKLKRGINPHKKWKEKEKGESSTRLFHYI